jgi:hypothetical protein
MDLKTAIATWKEHNTKLQKLKSGLKIINNKFKSEMYPLKQQIYETETLMEGLVTPIYDYMKTNEIDDIAADNSIIRYTISHKGPSLTKDAIKMRLLEHFKDEKSVANMMTIIVDERDSVDTVKLKCLTPKKKK